MTAPDRDVDRLNGVGECRIVEGRFATVVQGSLALMVVSSLVYKRWREYPQRTMTVWAMDTSKQIFSGGLQHCVNVLLALLFASQGETKAGECIWYFANFSTTLIGGLFILTAYMRLHRWVVKRYGLEEYFNSGNYGEPPRIIIWFVQMTLWCVVACAEKFITAICLILPFRGIIDEVIAKVEVPLKPYPKLELVIVMVINPAVLNTIFAWVVDNLIKVEDPQPGDDEDTDSDLMSDSPTLAIPLGMALDNSSSTLIDVSIAAAEADSAIPGVLRHILFPQSIIYLCDSLAFAKSRGADADQTDLSPSSAESSRYSISEGV